MNPQSEAGGSDAHWNESLSTVIVAVLPSGASLTTEGSRTSARLMIPDDKDRLFVEAVKRSRESLVDHIRRSQQSMVKSKRLLRQMDEIIAKSEKGTVAPPNGEPE
jgi:hypothetical protein